MTLDKTHVSNLRTHFLQEQETATLALGRALGKIELLGELAEFLDLPEPGNEEPPSEGPKVTQ
jgi:hypothetical protein